MSTLVWFENIIDLSWVFTWLWTARLHAHWIWFSHLKLVISSESPRWYHVLTSRWSYMTRAFAKVLALIDHRFRQTSASSLIISCPNIASYSSRSHTYSSEKNNQNKLKVVHKLYLGNRDPHFQGRNRVSKIRILGFENVVWSSLYRILVLVPQKVRYSARRKNSCKDCRWRRLDCTNGWS